MSEYADGYWTSRDGLKLHYRDYEGPADRPPLLCLPGLTRNARDFANFAERHAGQWRVLCPEMRGRGDSAYAKDSATYNPMQYVDDIAMMLDEAGIERFVAIGTSLGGLMTMIMALTMGDRLAGAMLNDIGPVVETAGLDRIRGYVGQGRSFSTWMHAARALEETQTAAYPRFDISDWLDLAKQVMVVSGSGRIVFDYDMKLAEPFAAAPVGADPDMWPMLAALGGRPLLFLRGELSDILGSQTLEQMVEMCPGADGVIVPQVGHAPTLDEPEAVAAVERLLARIAG